MPKDVSLSKQLPNNGTGKPSSPQKNEITVGCTSSPPQRKSLSLSLFPPSPLFKPERELHEY